ncbi:MAG: hypothetical protein HY654_13585 [Acidobacteria bacterium]|nr:hypothetical protein [Acidobacteriota bacterium]
MLKRLVFVAYFIEVGLLLVLVPWSTFWERNYFVEAMPVLGDFAKNNFVRGAISGLGVINLYAGLADLAAIMTARHR